MENEFVRIFKYAHDFYLKRLRLIIIFSIPFILAFLVLMFVPAPTYLSLGGVFLRTGSIPELSLIDLVVTAVGYVIAVFVIADTIVNINIIVRCKRTMTSIKQEVITAMGKYATRIFYIYTLMLLLLFIVQLLTYDNPLQSWLYPLFAFILSFLLFFVPPAVVIDNSNTAEAIRRSVDMALRNPDLVLIWTLLSLAILTFLKFFADLIFGPYAGYFVLLVNSLIVLPFLTVLQTQMYMEKYPLAR